MLYTYETNKQLKRPVTKGFRPFDKYYIKLYCGTMIIHIFNNNIVIRRVRFVYYNL